MPQIQNTSEGAKHLNAKGFEDVVVPGRKGDVNGTADASEDFVKAAKAVDVQGDMFKDGTLIVGEAPKPAPVPTVSEKAAANVQAVLDRQEVDSAVVEKAAKDKPKK